MRKTSVAAASVALATAGSAVLGGVALAGGHHHYHGEYAGNGEGGKAINNCLNVGIPILSGIGLGGEGKSKGASCKANANGYGGDVY